MFTTRIDPNRTRFKAYITKYALTIGIREIDAQDCFDTASDMIQDMTNSLAMYHRGDWHRSIEEASAKAEDMRVAKIGSLRKQIAKLEKLRF